MINKTLSSVLKLLILTDPSLFFKEFNRRIFGKEYNYKGLLIRNLGDFLALKGLLSSSDLWEYNITHNKTILLKNKKYNIYFEIPIDKLHILSILLNENTLELEIYNIKDTEIKNKRILDVGSHIGDTTLGFYIKGAKNIVAYEPIYHEYLIHNLQINNAKNIKVFPYGVWSEDYEIIYANKKIKLVSWETVLSEEYDLAKVDCEGGEWGLLAVQDSLLRNVNIWVVEIHGPSIYLVEKFKKAGFKAKLLSNPQNFVEIWRFEL